MKEVQSSLIKGTSITLYISRIITKNIMFLIAWQMCKRKMGNTALVDVGGRYACSLHKTEIMPMKPAID